jgi:guanylate kinase
MLYVITGPSGCGKSTLVSRVREELGDVEFSVSHTTRKKRNTERDGVDYYFVSEQEFQNLIEEEKLVEWAVVHGNHYGTSRRELEKKGTRGDLLLDIDVQGAQQIKEKFKKAVFVFILPPHFPELKKRLETRGQDSPGSIRERLEMAGKEIRYYSQFDYIVINDKLDKAAQELKSVILSQRCLLETRRKEIVSILRSFSGDE